MGACQSLPHSDEYGIPKISEKRDWLSVAIKEKAIIHHVVSDIGDSDNQFFEVDLNNDETVILKCPVAYSTSKLSLILDPIGVERAGNFTIKCEGKLVKDISEQINSASKNNGGVLTIVYTKGPKPCYTHLVLKGEYVVLLWAEKAKNLHGAGSLQDDVPILLRLNNRKQGVDLLVCDREHPQWILARKVYIQRPKEKVSIPVDYGTISKQE